MGVKEYKTPIAFKAALSSRIRERARLRTLPVLPRLGAWASDPARADVDRSVLVTELARALIALDGKKLPDLEMSSPGPMFAVGLYWALGGTERETSSRILSIALGHFWDGPRDLPDPRRRVDEPFRLLALAPRDAVRGALERAVREGPPRAAAMCQFLLSGIVQN